MNKIYKLIFCFALLNFASAQTCTPTITASSNAICYSATATLTATGGTTYTWSANAGGVNSGSVVITPSVTDVYTVTAATGTCTATETITIYVNPNPNVNAIGASMCSGDSVSLCATGALTYTWAPGGVTSSCDKVSPSSTGIYTVVGTDANGCIGTASVVVNVYPSPSATFTMQATGTPHVWDAYATFTGGTSPYTYSWNWGDGTSSSTAFPSHTYSVAAIYNICATITDANGCISQVCQSDSLYRMGNNSPTSVILVDVHNSSTVSCSVTVNSFYQPTCPGVCDGSILFDIPSSCFATPVYAVWSNLAGCTPIPTTTVALGTTYTVSGLCPSLNAYGVQFTNDPNTLDSTYGIYTFHLANPIPARVLNFTSQQPVCYDSCNGKVIAQLNTSGTLPITVSWTKPNPVGVSTHTVNSYTSDTLFNACAGIYTVNLTDANGCVSTQSVTTLGQPAQIVNSVTTTSLACSGSHGSACTNVSGGTPPYTYAWSPAGGSSSCAANLAAGSYNSIVTDANGCVNNTNFTVSGPAALFATITSTSPSCPTCSDGTLCANVSGGTPSYSYTWTPGSVNTSCLNGVAPGVYTLCVTDVNGCIVCKVKTMVANSIQGYSNAQPAISLYPNPTNSDITIMSAIDINSITIYDVLGNVVFIQRQEIKSDQTLKIDVKNFERGVYLLKAVTSMKQQTIKFIKE